MTEVERLRALALEWDEEHGHETGELPPIMDALIAAVRAEERDLEARRWLTQLAGAEGNAMLAIARMGYELRDGAFRKIEEARDGTP